MFTVYIEYRIPCNADMYQMIHTHHITAVVSKKNYWHLKLMILKMSHNYSIFHVRRFRRSLFSNSW